MPDPRSLPLLDLAEARKLTQTWGYRISQIMRKRIEELFGGHGMHGASSNEVSGALFVCEQVLLTAAAQNIKRMARLLSRIEPKRKVAILGGYLLSLYLSFGRVISRFFTANQLLLGHTI